MGIQKFQFFKSIRSAEGSDGEDKYRYHEESDTDDHVDDNYNGLTLDEIVKMFKAKIDKRFEVQDLLQNK